MKKQEPGILNNSHLNSYSFNWIDDPYKPTRRDNQMLQWERVDDNHIILELGCKKAVIHTEKEALKWLNKTIKKYIKDNNIFGDKK